MFSNAPNQEKRIKVIQRDAKLYHFIPYVFIFYSIHLSSLWLLLAKEIDSDLKAKKEFIRSVWGGRSCLGLKGDCRAMLGTEKRLPVCREWEHSTKTPVLLLTWADPNVTSARARTPLHSPTPERVRLVEEACLCAHQPIPSSGRFLEAALRGVLGFCRQRTCIWFCAFTRAAQRRRKFPQRELKWCWNWAGSWAATEWQTFTSSICVVALPGKTPFLCLIKAAFSE